MQVDLMTVLGTFSAVLSVALGLYLAMAKYAIAQREKEIDRRIGEIKTMQERQGNDCNVELRKVSERLYEEEKATIQQAGEINVVRSEHDGVKKNLDDIRQAMVTKAEFEPRIASMERTLNQILAELRTPPRYTSSAQHPSLPVQGKPSGGR